MKKLIIVPAVLAMLTASGAAFADGNINFAIAQLTGNATGSNATITQGGSGNGNFAASFTNSVNSTTTIDQSGKQNLNVALTDLGGGNNNSKNNNLTVTQNGATTSNFAAVYLGGSNDAGKVTQGGTNNVNSATLLVFGNGANSTISQQ